MILSVSRRTDVPAFYSEWFTNRLREGYVLVPNPYNTKQLSRIELSPEVVDCIVLWTKDAAPMTEKLSQMEELGYNDYYFEFTITAYDESIECQLPPKDKVIDSFRLLSDKIGSRRVDWRFDPVILNEQIAETFILSRFEEMCRLLANYTEKCIISFVDAYKHTPRSFSNLPLEKQESLAKSLGEIAASYSLPLYTCCEEQDFSMFGIQHAACIDRKKVEDILGCQIVARKDAGQRKECGCIESVDIGMYNTCNHGCAYCYATRSVRATEQNRLLHDPCSPMLIGIPNGYEVITSRIMKSLKCPQLPLRYEG